MKKLVLFLLVIAITFSSIGCGTKQTTTDILKGATITDHLGREVTIEKMPDKIVSGYYITSSMLVALGLKEKVVGIEAKANSRHIYKLASPEFLDLPNVGTAKEFNLEGTIALKPDLVILPIRLKEAIESLEKMDIKVLGVNPEDMELLIETIDMIGKATDTGEAAYKLKSYYNNKLKELENYSKGKEKKRIYLGGNSDFLSTATKKMYQNYLIETAGGINVASDIDDSYWATISNEQLIKYNPDIIIIVPGATYTKDDILKDPKYTSLNAVKNNEVYAMPDSFEMWDSPVPSSILGIMWLSSILHEDSYSFNQYKEEVFGFYKEFYKIQINKDDIKR